jgi:hypothetical protein
LGKKKKKKKKKNITAIQNTQEPDF